MWAEQRPFSQATFESLSGEPALRTIPSWYLVATQDHAIPPRHAAVHGRTRACKDRAGQASHVPMISQPAATTKLILEAAKAVG
jgi:pimeloyl-ACP methyl ester carboxylesterase